MAQLDQQQKLPVLAARDIVIFPTVVIPLYVGRPPSLIAIEKGLAQGGYLVCITQKDAEKEEVSARDLYRFGVLVKILQAVKIPDGSMKLLVEGISRVEVDKIEKNPRSKMMMASVRKVAAEDVSKKSTQSLMRVLEDKFSQYLRSSEQMNLLDAVSGLSNANNIGDYTDLIAAHLPVNVAEKQQLLETKDVSERVKRLLVVLEQEMQWHNKEKEILDKVRDEVNDDQQSYYIRKKMKIFEDELRKMGDSASSEGLNYEKKIKALKLSEDLEEKLLTEISKLKYMPEMSAEASVVRNYLDTVLAIPWNQYNKINNDLSLASRKLNKHHFGLTKVKERVLEALAVSLRVSKVKAPIICLVGPPGVGKTSLGKSIAEAMGRSFVRVALGGVRDESEIRGHRRTYIGAMPGQIVRALTKAKSMNPLIMLDEVDKMGMDFRGDPASALLEVLDPEQNSTFNDHYIEADVDLSKALFITTANTLDMPSALLDRMEIIHLSGYTEEEKKEISSKYLIDKCFSENGLKKGELEITENALLDIIRSYTREAGVRECHRHISKICRKVVKKKLSQKKESSKAVVVDKKDLSKYLDTPLYESLDVNKLPKVGVVHGLAWTMSGGELLNIEAVSLPGKGDLVYTGSLGEVMQESIRTAHSVVRGISKKYKLKKNYFSDYDFHVHVPEGATPKDGPSAGIGMATVLLSVATNKKVKNKIAMTGELTLTGEVLPIGGLKEKILAAIRSGANEVIIPKGNKKDLNEFKKDISGKIEVHLVSNISEVFNHAIIS